MSRYHGGEASWPGPALSEPLVLEKVSPDERTALALVSQCGEPNVGVNFDVYHYYTGPSKFEDFDHLTVDRLAHVQFCDLAGVARELAMTACGRRRAATLIRRAAAAGR